MPGNVITVSTITAINVRTIGLHRLLYTLKTKIHFKSLYLINHNVLVDLHSTIVKTDFNK